ncbi:DUF802 domain-containing protein [Accumulibacter sp.]|uniref:DUF802 domain-containing protein n=1 Tax=Accumulibacter sp. TaxID=2053492 RepID=UPI0025ECC361|nr:DUF802 domain-containing protein [Accumulibacter sp.]MCM8611139.1 DUF802 domain-containing protein [Accumulibacter sp.]MCM8636253.1 DUF802 domain-containing protein [Accumulibacter sp.]MCM8638464.1 DUF802 domain-containing protein [Accumulibacter sp.]
MNRSLCALAFLSGAGVVVWVGAGFVGSNHLALLMTLVIAAVYLLGALEILGFRRATESLAQALAEIPERLAHLGDWLGGLHPSLQNAVRLRIEGERGGLPGPALTPYLVGLLVMLGMLGTFLGMVVTLDGAVAALHGTTDLQAMRAGLVAPIRGLGLAFGTSVAGVAASAMLGLISALSRRDRALVAQLLDARIATSALRGFSLGQQRQEAWQALQLQARAMPAVVDRLHALIGQMEQREKECNERLVAGQERFHGEIQAAYGGLARSVAESLAGSLRESARVAGENIRPAVEGAMAAIARETKLAHERVIESTGIQLEGLAARFGETAQSVAQTWTEVLATQRGTSDRLLSGIEHSLAAFDARLEQRSQALLAAVGETLSTSLANQAAAERQRFAAWTGSLADLAAALRGEWQAAEAQTLARQEELCSTLEKTAQAVSEQAQAHVARTLDATAPLLAACEELVRSRIAGEADWIAGHGERMDQMAGLWRAELGALRDAEERRGAAAVERLGELQAALATHLQRLGAALEEPLARLIATASEAPQAAAELIVKLRQEMSGSLERDNRLLEERARIMQTLAALLAAIDQASSEQRATIDTLVSSSATLLDTAGSRFAGEVDAGSARLAEVATRLSGSAVEVASLGEAFALAVDSFATGNEKLVASLQRIEMALEQSTARSDEQLAYYVAQARELIDLSIMAQEKVVAELRQLGDRHPAGSEEPD